MTNESQNNPTAEAPELKKSTFATWKILLPVAIGITAVALMFWHDARNENIYGIFSKIEFSTRTLLCILGAFLCIFGRDFGLTWRFRALTDYQLPWRKAWKVDMLCEFTSCVTPSAVGGSSLGMVYLNSEGVEFGRATTLMMTTLFLDELFFVIACPIVVILTPVNEVFASGATDFSHGIKVTFWAIYSVLFLWTALLFMGIIVRPRWVNNALHRLFSIKWLLKWRPKIDSLTENMIATSDELRKKKVGFWLRVFGGTALSWMSRFMVVNMLFLGFLPQDDPYEWIIFARQFVIWVVLMLSPTPGGSGLSEWLFSEYYGDMVSTAGMALILAICWRIVSYYLYLLIGACIVPGWVRQTVGRFRKTDGGKNDITTNEN